MNKRLLVPTIACLAGACAQEPVQPITTECGGPSANPPTQITYGDSQIVTKPKSNVKAGREFQFMLKPKHDNENDEVDHDTVLVTVIGKDAASSWIGGSATKEMTGPSGKFFGGCVPTDAENGTIYRYEVRVETVGTLDPRAEVVN